MNNKKTGGKSLAIIILNWNGEKLLRQFLPAATRDCISPDADLIVADNGSADGSVEFVVKNYPRVKIIRFEENLGFAEGYNRAIQESAYPYTILLNSDVETTPGFYEPMLEYMKSHPDVGAVQPKIRAFGSREMFEYAGAAGGFLDNLGYPYCRGRIMESVEKDDGQYDGAPADVTWASGACLMVRTGAYLELGGLDSRFFAHMEEIDLCCRMRAAGYRIVAVPDSVVFHVGGASLPQGNPKKTYLNFRNSLLLLYKNLPAAKGRRIIFLRRLADALAFVMFLLKGAPQDARAILRAHSDYRKMRKNYSPAPDSAPSPLDDRSILLEYYIKRKKKYGELKNADREAPVDTCGER